MFYRLNQHFLNCAVLCAAKSTEAVLENSIYKENDHFKSCLIICLFFRSYKRRSFSSGHTTLSYWTSSSFEIFVSKTFPYFRCKYKSNSQHDTKTYVIEITGLTMTRENRLIHVPCAANLKMNFKESSLSLYRSSIRQDYTKISKIVVRCGFQQYTFVKKYCILICVSVLKINIEIDYELNQIYEPNYKI